MMFGLVRTKERGKLQQAFGSQAITDRATTVFLANCRGPAMLLPKFIVSEQLVVSAQCTSGWGVCVRKLSSLVMLFLGGKEGDFLPLPGSLASSQYQ